MEAYQDANIPFLDKNNIEEKMNATTAPLHFPEFLFKSLPLETQGIPVEVWKHIFLEGPLEGKALKQLRLVNKLFNEIIINSQELFEILTGNSLRYVPKTYAQFRSFFNRRFSIVDTIEKGNPKKFQISFTTLLNDYSSPTFTIVDEDIVILLAHEKMYKINLSTNTMLKIKYPKLKEKNIEFHPVKEKIFKVPFSSFKENGFVNYPQTHRPVPKGKYICISNYPIHAVFNVLSNQFQYLCLANENIVLKDNLAFHNITKSILCIDLDSSKVIHRFELKEPIKKLNSVSIFENIFVFSATDFGHLPGSDENKRILIFSKTEKCCFEVFFEAEKIKIINEKYFLTTRSSLYKDASINIHKIDKLFKRHTNSYEYLSLTKKAAKPPSLEKIHPLEKVQFDGDFFNYEGHPYIINVAEERKQNLPGNVNTEHISPFVKLINHQVITFHHLKNPHFQMTPLPPNRENSEKQISAVFKKQIPIQTIGLDMIGGTKIDEYQFFGALMENTANPQPNKEIFFLDTFTKTILGSRKIKRTKFYRHEFSKGLFLELSSTVDGFNDYHGDYKKCTFTIWDYSKNETSNLNKIKKMFFK